MHPLDTPLTPLSYLDRSARVFGAELAVVDGPRRWTYAELADQVQRWAKALRALGIRDGERVAFLATNSAELLTAHFAVPLAGGVLVAINTRLSAEEVAYICTHCEATVLAFDPSLAAVVEQVRDQVPNTRLVVLPDEDGTRVEVPGAGVAADLIAAVTGDDLPYEVVDETAMISINYTSGTTGKPKGVMYSHRGAALNAVNQVITMGLSQRSAYLWTLPMFHCNGWCMPWAVTAAAATHVCLRAVRGPDIWRLFSQERITHLCGAPTVLTIIASDSAAHELERPVTMMTAGAPPSPTIIERMSSLGATIVHVYGLTETYGPYSICERQPSWAGLGIAELAVKMARQGVASVLSDRVRVVDTMNHTPDELVDVPTDGTTMGEIVMRGNITMLGYYKDEDATREAFRGGWFHSGDLGVMHADGYIQLLDRAKDVVISGGENISTVEVEQAVLRHDAVADVAVIGVPDERWGEVTKAYVVTVAEREVSAADLIAFVKTKIAGYKAPKHVEFVPELPKTATGKIRKNELRQSAWAGQASRIQG